MMKRTPLLIFLTFFVLAAFPSLVMAGSATLHWQPDSAPDLAGYRVYYGTASRSYGPYIPVGNVTSYTLNNLTDGQTYYFAVTAVDTSGNESGYSAEVSKKITTQTGLPSASYLIPDKNSPQVEGTVVNIRASATGGSGSYEYKFWVMGPATGNVWKMVQDYSASSTYSWNTTGAAGQNLIGVWVRNAGSSSEYQAYTSISYTVKSSTPSITGVKLSTSAHILQNEGTVITVRASATGGSGSYEYRFWVMGPATGNVWKMVQDYSASSTYSWNTTGAAGQNLIGVWVRNAGSSSEYQAYSSINYAIK